ncbi:MAG TPA: hypothetical protein VMT35_01630 [Ignavibacteriaceae bacterium]|nr:hypothetical protein [Ignavibacteriaceae bacterium]
MFLRFFNIDLVAVYFFCCYAQIICPGNLSGPNEISFSASVNHTNGHAWYTAATLHKHTFNLNQHKVNDHSRDVTLHYRFERILSAHFILFSGEGPSRIILNCPLNKAPPACI